MEFKWFVAGEYFKPYNTLIYSLALVEEEEKKKKKLPWHKANRTKDGGNCDHSILVQHFYRHREKSISIWQRSRKDKLPCTMHTMPQTTRSFRKMDRMRDETGNNWLLTWINPDGKTWMNFQTFFNKQGTQVITDKKKALVSDSNWSVKLRKENTLFE